jgi:hypothetical protein
MLGFDESGAIDVFYMVVFLLLGLKLWRSKLTKDLLVFGSISVSLAFGMRLWLHFCSHYILRYVDTVRIFLFYGLRTDDTRTFSLRGALGCK